MKWLRWLFPILLCFSVQANAGSYSQIQTYAVPAFTFTHVQVGGAGAVTGVTATTAGTTLVSRTDQFGCYVAIYTAGAWSQWTQLETTTAMPSGSVTNASGGPIGTGCDSAIPDPSNGSNLLVGFSGNIYYSTNAGASFSATCYPTQSASLPAQTQAVKGFGHKTAIDPNNSAVWYMSTPDSGLEFTNNSGATCSVVSSVGDGGQVVSGVYGGHLIAFDTSGGTTTVSGQTRTKSIYVSTYGTGVYHSNDGGQTWALTSSGPTTHLYMTVDTNGIVWFVDDSYNGGGDNLGKTWKYASGTWTDLSGTISTIAAAVAYDPQNCPSGTESSCHIAFQIAGGNGGTALTTNGGSTWNVATGNLTITASDVPWIANQVAHGASGFYGSGAAFDNSGHLYTGDEGMFYTTPPTSGSAVTYISQTAGIEEFEDNVVVNAPSAGGKLLIGGWDVGCFYLNAPFTSFPTNSQHGCYSPNASNLQHAYAIDWVAGTPTDMVSMVDNQTYAASPTYVSYSGTSSDGGQTWSSLAAPSGVSSSGYPGGCMAASSTNDILWLPTDGSGGSVAPYYTTNGGSSWSQISVSGVTGGWGAHYSFSNHVCAADRVNAATYYIYNWNTGSNDALIKCTSGGASCSILLTPGFSQAYSPYNPTLATVPGQAGYVFLAYGPVDPPSDISGNGFYYYANGGSLQTAPNVTSVTAFGFGAAAPGHTFPAIYIAGWVSHVYGIWQCTNWDNNPGCSGNWTQIGTYPRNIPLPILSIDADKTNYGVVYLGTVSGIFCGSISPAYCNGSTDLLNRDLDPASNDNTPAYLDKVG